MCAGVLSVLLASVTEPHLMRDSSLAYLGVLAGLTVGLLRHSSVPARAEKTPRAVGPAGPISFRLMTGAKRV